MKRMCVAVLVFVCAACEQPRLFSSQYGAYQCAKSATVAQGYESNGTPEFSGDSMYGLATKYRGHAFSKTVVADALFEA